MSKQPITVHCDGLCKPNPGGIATFGWVAYRGKKRIRKHSAVVCSGSGATNNVAEYSAVISALEWLLSHNHNDRKITVWTDSQLVVRQAHGKYAVRSRLLAPLNRKVKLLAEEFVDLKLQWFPRERNEEADVLSNDAYNRAVARAVAPRKTTRLEKARGMTETVIPLAMNLYHVPSQSSPDVVYTVNISKNTCTCLDFQMRGARIGYCKHILAVRLRYNKTGMKPIAL